VLLVVPQGGGGGTHFSHCDGASLCCQSQSSVTTDGQTVLVSSRIWGTRPDFCYCQLRVCSCGAPSLMRGRVCRLPLLLALASPGIFTAVATLNWLDALAIQPRGGPNSRQFTTVPLLWCHVYIGRLFCLHYFELSAAISQHCSVGIHAAYTSDSCHNISVYVH
jgi:hypothetical protein